jgi:hypothetical protein
MAQIINIFTRESITIPQPAFEPLEDSLLNSTSPLTKAELKRIKESMKESNYIIDLCHDDAHDVIDFHDKYLNRCEQRIESSPKVKKQSKKNSAKLKVIS